MSSYASGLESVVTIRPGDKEEEEEEEEEKDKKSEKNNNVGESKKLLSSNSKLKRSKSVEMKERVANQHAKQATMMTFAPPDLLKKMWHEFSLETTHVMYNEPLKLNSIVVAGDFSGLADEEALDSEVCTVDNLRIDLPELNFSLDAEQFFTTVDVIRNVLLAPPPPKRNYEVEIRSGGADGIGAEVHESLRESDRFLMRSTSRESDFSRSASGSSSALPRSNSFGVGNDANISGIKRRAENRRFGNPNSTVHGGIGDSVGSGSSPRPSSASTSGGGANRSPATFPPDTADPDGRVNTDVDADTDKNRRSSITEAVREMLNKTKLSNKRGRIEMKDFLNDILGELEEKWAEALQLQSVSWGVGRGSWKIKHINKLDDVEVSGQSDRCNPRNDARGLPPSRIFLVLTLLCASLSPFSSRCGAGGLHRIERHD